MSELNSTTATSTQEFETIMAQLNAIKLKLDERPSRDEMTSAINRAVEHESDQRKRALEDALCVEREARRSELSEMKAAFDAMLANMQQVMNNSMGQFNAVASRVEQGFAKLAEDVMTQGQTQAKTVQRLDDLAVRVQKTEIHGDTMALSYRSMSDRLFGSDERPDDVSVLQTLRALPDIINRQAEERLRGINGRLDMIQAELDPMQAWYKNRRTWEDRLANWVGKALQSKVVWLLMASAGMAFFAKLVQLLGGQ